MKDEADADALFQYSWEVRAPKGRVLYFPDVSSSITKKNELMEPSSSWRLARSPAPMASAQVKLPPS